MPLNDNTQEAAIGYEMRLNNASFRKKADPILRVIVSGDGDEIIESDEQQTKTSFWTRKKCIFLFAILFCLVAGGVAVTFVYFFPFREEEDRSAASAVEGSSGESTASEEKPTLSPTQPPTVAPTNAPTNAPTFAPTSSPTFAPTVDPFKAMLAEYEITWEGVLNGCRNATLPMNASCPMFAAFKSNLYEECYQDSPRSVYCKSELDAPLKMGCYGPSPEDLQLQVTVSADSYHCMKLLHEDSALASYFGGNVTTTASAKAACQDSIDLTCTSDSTLQTPMGTEPRCVKSSSCQVEWTCTLTDKDFLECDGKESCELQVGPVGFNTSVPSESCFKDFYLATAVGEPCEYDVMCSSKICIGGICMAGKVDDGETCEVESHCLNGPCARTKLNETTLACCPSGEAVNTNGFWYCTQPAGANCLSNELCVSDVCVEGQCREDFVTAKGICDDNLDCMSEVCAHFYTNSSLACCVDGMTVSINNKTYCTELPAGSPCIDEESCESGICIFNLCYDELFADKEVCAEGPNCVNGACGYPTSSRSGDMVCCPKGESFTRRIGKTVTGTDYTFCKGAKAGTKCGTFNQLCASGLCINGECREEALADNEVCVEGPDCANLACGYPTSANSGDMICCPEGKFFTKSFGEGDSSFVVTYCKGAEAGTSCGTYNQLCASELCINGECRDEALDDYAICAEGPDCVNAACGYPTPTRSGDMICCRDGEFFARRIGGSITGTDFTFCGGAESGMPCGTYNDMCASGLCINGMCRKEALADNEVCVEGFDCANAACGYPTSASSGDMVCCPEGKFFTQLFGAGDNSLVVTFCKGAEAGTTCGTYNELCASELCTDGICT